MRAGQFGPIIEGCPRVDRPLLGGPFHHFCMVYAYHRFVVTLQRARGGWWASRATVRSGSSLPGPSWSWQRLLTSLMYSDMGPPLELDKSLPHVVFDLAKETATTAQDKWCTPPTTYPLLATPTPYPLLPTTYPLFACTNMNALSPWHPRNSPSRLSSHMQKACFHCRLRNVGN